jgi:hypothetical protein
MKFQSDIDIDFADRNDILKRIRYIPASIQNSAHNTGIYVTNIPVDPFTGRSSLDYKEAEQRGYCKLDFLNVNLYKQINNENHLIELMNREPPWDKLYTRSFCEQIIHINNHYDTLIRMPESVNTIPRLAMFLAVIRPGKRHLIGLPWSKVGQTIWQRPSDGEYYYKKSHGIAYAHLVVVNMNLLDLSNQGN